jgi:hypothetical protein
VCSMSCARSHFTCQTDSSEHPIFLRHAMEPPEQVEARRSSSWTLCGIPALAPVSQDLTSVQSR